MKDEVTFCVHESCDATKCGVEKEEELLARLVTIMKKLGNLVTCGNHKEGPDKEKIRLPGNSRSQFLLAYQKSKERKASKRQRKSQ